MVAARLRSSSPLEKIAILVAPALQFPRRGVLSIPSEAKVKSKSSTFILAVVLALLTGAVAPRTANAQDITPAAGSRKIRTKTVPEYPALARQMNVSGKVKLEVTIAPDGHVVSTKTVGGSPLLVGPATDAVKRWRYEPAPKESTEVVEFNFSDRN
jgi:TonB family protein